MPTTGMEKFRVQIAIVFAMVSLVNAFPAPQLDEDGQELLGGKDTRYYGMPFFWFGRPFYEDNDDYTGNGGLNIDTNGKRSSTVSYANVGGGWGR